jgi:hypothetical protein
MVKHFGHDKLRFQQVTNGFSVPGKTSLVERVEGF